MDEPDPDESGWEIAYRGPGAWAAVDEHGNDVVTGGYSAVLQAVASNPRNPDGTLVRS